MDIHQARKCHQIAMSFLETEIKKLQWSYKFERMDEQYRKRLKKRLKELEAEFDEISQYDF